LILQLLGTLTILVGLEKTRTVFDLPSLGASSAAWLRSFPKLRDHRVVSGSANLATGGTLSARATVSHRAPGDASLDERVRVIESNIKSLELRTEQLQAQLDKSNLARTKALDEERRRRETDIALLSRKLEAAEADGINTSQWGLIWLTIGLLLSTASQEIAHIAFMIAA
jgi:hypothetical protein